MAAVAFRAADASKVTIPRSWTRVCFKLLIIGCVSPLICRGSDFAANERGQSPTERRILKAMTGLDALHRSESGLVQTSSMHQSAIDVRLDELKSLASGAHHNVQHADERTNHQVGGNSESHDPRRLQGSEEASFIIVDFEDGKLAPFSQVGSGWKQPMPMRYFSMNAKRPEKDQYTLASGGGGKFFFHTGTDSGVRVRRGEERIGEFESSPFILGPGAITFEACGSGGFFAVCPVDRSKDCLEKQIGRRSTNLAFHEFSADELADFVGMSVYFRLVDNRRSGWAFVAIDNLMYPAMASAETVSSPTRPPPISSTASASPSPSISEPIRQSPDLAFANETTTTTSVMGEVAGGMVGVQ